MVKTSQYPSFDDDLHTHLNERESDAIRRRLRPISSGIGPRIVVDGRSILQFCSNDYLGITSHPVVTRAAEMALSRYGTGSGSARLVLGTSSPHSELEQGHYSVEADRGGVSILVRISCQYGCSTSTHGVRRCYFQRHAQPREHYRWMPSLTCHHKHLPPQRR